MNTPNSIFQKLSVALIALLYALSCSSSSPEDVVAERIKAVGTVCVEGDDCAKNLAKANASNEPKTTEEIYKSGCSSCHDPGTAGAPKFRDAADWGDRLAAGLDSVYSNAINGQGAMPPKGVCPTCSDDEIKAAVDYMIEGL